ncbi:MAG: dihydrodipicolinate reductase [Candidatus Brockarchaeota archaeon]|nr:dihydrodipicolinate reductase [Candidatus Brockarchaeota archaeon]
MATVKFVQYGLGPIGCGIARHVISLPGYKIVGALDIDPQKVGRDVGEVLGLGRKLNLPVSSDPSVIKRSKAQLVLHATGSRLVSVRRQLFAAINAGCSVVSTCEELVYPSARNPRLAREIDRLARRKGVAVLGVGVNPGFVMDALPLFLTSVCKQVRKIEAKRIVDASKRRLPLQRKVGAGLSVEEFYSKVRAKELGHVGLLESARMVADGLGWKLENLSETIEPVVAEEKVETQFLAVEKGMVAGIKQVAKGTKAGEEVLTLELQMYVGAKDPHDSVLIDGEPPVDAVIRGGIHGDSATVAIVANSIPRVLASKPGLVTVRDLPIVAFAGNLQGRCRANK